MRRLAAAFAAAAVLCTCAPLAGCDNKDESSAAGGDVTVTKTAPASAQPVEVRSYSFPEFLSDKDCMDMFSNAAGSFDAESASAELEASPFTGYNCVRVMLGEYYVFRKDGYEGILNLNGAVIVEADKYASVRPVSDHIICLEYPEQSGLTADLIFVNGGLGNFISQSFDPAAVTVTEIQSEKDDKPQYVLTVNGIDDEHRFDSISEVSGEGIVTSLAYKKLYRAASGNKIFYLAVDEYYNITVCEAAYAQVKLRAGSDYGECYIRSYEDYSELRKMIASFGLETAQVKPSKDESLDYIQITFGLESSPVTTFTLSADGFSLSDQQPSGPDPAPKFFTVYPKETFSDLVNWVGEVLSQEYAAE